MAKDMQNKSKCWNKEGLYFDGSTSTEHALKRKSHISITVSKSGYFKLSPIGTGVFCGRKDCFKEKLRKHKTLHLYVISQIFPT